MEPNLKDIKALVFDIDGVLTGGELIPLSDHDLVRVLDAKDAFAVRVAGRKGLITGIISGGKTEGLHYRCLNLGIREENIYLGVRGKLAAFRDFCQRNALDASEVMYFGDDIPDIQVLRACGVGVAPADAAAEAKEAADIVSPFPGGRGCVRNGIEQVLKAQGKWVFDPDKYDQIY